MTHQTPSADSEERLKRLMEMQSSIYAFLTGLLPPDADIDVVLQDINMVVWKALNEDKIEKFDAFVYGVARNKARNCVRSLGRNRLVLCDDSLLQRLADRWEEQSQHDKAHGRQLALRRCLAKLKDLDRQRMEAYYSDRTPLREIAQGEGRSEAALYQIFHRLRKKLKLCIERNLLLEGELG